MSVPKEIKDFIVQGWKQPDWLLPQLLPAYFPEPLTWFQKAAVALYLRRTDFLIGSPDLDLILSEIVEVREDGTKVPMFHVADGNIYIRQKQNVLFMLPRGFGKTTLLGNACPLYSILYCAFNFMVYVSQAADHARMQLDAVKRELESNTLIQSVWGNLVPERNDAERWSKEQIETNNNVILIAKSRGSQIRGLKVREHRPDLLIFDDLQDLTELSTSQTLENDKAWFNGSALNTLGTQDNARAIALGTYLGPGTIIDSIKTLAADDRTSWGMCSIGVRMSSGELTWSSKMPAAKIEQKRHEAELNGNEHVFWREYMNVDVPTAKRPFLAQYIIIEEPTGPMQVGMFMDPALSDNRRADKCAIVVWGVCRETGIRYKLHEWAERTTDVDLICTTYVELSRAYNVSIHGIETNGFQSLLLGPIRIAQDHAKRQFSVHCKIHHDPKRGRIIGVLQPLYKGGYVRWVRNFESKTDLLKYVTVGFNGKDDVLDADAACNVMLDDVSCQVGPRVNKSARNTPYRDRVAYRVPAIGML